jgi:hypothetical protein
MHARKGIDIDEAAIDLPPGRSPTQRIDGGTEGALTSTDPSISTALSAAPAA